MLTVSAQRRYSAPTNPLIDSDTPVGVKPVGLSSYAGSIAFSDEFNGSSVDSARWQNGGWDPESMSPDAPEWQRHSVQQGTTWEPEQYDPSGASLTAGSLVLTLRDENIIPDQTDPAFPFTSGMIHTSNRFAASGGFFEVRGKFSGVPGSWPAAWMLPQAFGWPPEGDIVENWGQTPGNSTWGFFDASHAHTSGNLTGDSTQWHTYGAHWVPGVSWTAYYDGVAQVPVTVNIPTAPMYLILNHAGDYRTGMVPNPATMPIPIYFDYARVWALS